MTNLHEPGTVATYRNAKLPSDQHNGKRFTVLDPTADPSEYVRNDPRCETRNLVKGENGLRWWFLPENLEPAPTAAITLDELNLLVDTTAPARDRSELAARLREELGTTVTTYTVTVTQDPSFTGPVPAASIAAMINQSTADGVSVEVEMNR